MKVAKKYLVATVLGFALSVFFPFSIKKTPDPCPLVAAGVDAVGDALYRTTCPNTVIVWPHVVYNVVINVALLNTLVFVIHNLNTARNNRRYRGVQGMETELKEKRILDNRPKT